MTYNVDLLVVSADDQPLPAAVELAIAHQQGVRLNAYRQIARPRADDPNRWATIVRGRNLAKQLGSAPWVLFLDDDVVLDPACVRTLVEQLERLPTHAALAADYLGERQLAEPAPHVAMGATLFRRAALERITFRWEPGKCECQCCCNDLRRMFLGIDYCRVSRAYHIARRPHARPPDESPTAAAGTELGGGVLAAAASPPSGLLEAHILTAFDRRHYDLFRGQFLASLRESGNHEWVTAVAYNLYPSQLRALRRLPRVEVLGLPAAVGTPSRRRLRDFQTAIAHLAPQTPVGYWDAGDVVFQASLQPLWDLVRAHPDKLLAAREPAHPGTKYVVPWTQLIPDPVVRRQYFELLMARPYLAAGFAAATAGTLMQYLRYAFQLREHGWMARTANHGDSACFNLYCRLHPDRWLEIDECWNYCIGGRGRREVYWDGGRYVSRRGDVMHVVHGNRGTLPNVGRYQPRF